MKWREDIALRTRIYLCTLGTPAYIGILQAVPESDGNLRFRATIDGDEMPKKGSLFELQLVGTKEIWRTSVTVRVSDENEVVLYAEKPLEKLQRREHFRVRTAKPVTLAFENGDDELIEVEAITLDMSAGGAKAKSEHTSDLKENTTYHLVLTLKEDEPLFLQGKVLSITKDIFTISFEGATEGTREAIFQHVWTTQRNKLK
jgi:c-di-GMP-binding flagellar brake protein YcgR